MKQTEKNGIVARPVTALKGSVSQYVWVVFFHITAVKLDVALQTKSRQVIGWAV